MLNQSQITNKTIGHSLDSFRPIRMQMFLWNNIFLSLGFDVKDHFKDFGGDNAAYSAPVSRSIMRVRVLRSSFYAITFWELRRVQMLISILKRMKHLNWVFIFY